MADKTAEAAPPNTFVIFGAGGDLTKRKLLPSLCNLFKQKLLPDNFAVVGVVRQSYTDESFRAYLATELSQILGSDFQQECWQAFMSRIYVAELDFHEFERYSDLSKRLDEIDQKHNCGGNALFYMATPPRFFCEIIGNLKNAGLTEESDNHWRRVIIEKPFGTNLESAKELNRKLHEYLNEHQIYRIDHYLGKETVQNILAYRFANSTVEPIWNHRYVDHVQITVSESVGVENRASYYDTAGAMRDMIPNHLLAVLSIVAMEPPNSFDADAVRDEQTKVLRAIQPYSAKDVLTQTVRGQYGAGKIRGKQVSGYRQEKNIAPDSTTETYVAMKVMIDSWRWVGVPFYIRTGKRMPARFTEIAVFFKHAPNAMFRDASFSQKDLPHNMLVLRLQPYEGIDMTFNAKKPGPKMNLSSVTMDFHYEEHFGKTTVATGYETLLYDCMYGDATLFKRADNIEVCWDIVDPILDVWRALPAREFPNYDSGTWGPQEADELLERDGRYWKDCGNYCSP